jgi:diaminopimelate epimerase
VRDRGLTTKDTIRVKTRGGVIEPQLLLDGEVRVNMGGARLLATDVPFDDRGLLRSGSARAPEYSLTVAGRLLSIGIASMGNPHVVVTVPDVATAEVATFGPLLEHHERFPERVNAGFMQLIDRNRVALRVWERGAGETLACGTGACAAAVIGIARGLLASPVKVETKGGPLVIEWDGDAKSPVYLTGPALSVFEGEIDLVRLDAQA